MLNLRTFKNKQKALERKAGMGTLGRKKHLKKYHHVSKLTKLLSLVQF